MLLLDCHHKLLVLADPAEIGHQRPIAVRWVAAAVAADPRDLARQILHPRMPAPEQVVDPKRLAAVLAVVGPMQLADRESWEKRPMRPAVLAVEPEQVGPMQLADRES